MPSKSIAAVILAGGKSSRFGTDKAIYDFQGRPLVSYVIDALSGFAPRIIMSVSPGNAELFTELFGDSVTIIEDDEEYQGPLHGLKKALSKVDEEFVLVAPCDMPFLSRELYRHLIFRIGDYDAAIPILNGFFEPIIGIYRTTILKKAIDRCISRGEKKLSSILVYLSVTGINEMELKGAGIDRMIFLNINLQP